MQGARFVIQSEIAYGKGVRPNVEPIANELMMNGIIQSCGLFAGYAFHVHGMRVSFDVCPKYANSI